MFPSRFSLLFFVDYCLLLLLFYSTIWKFSEMVRMSPGYKHSYLLLYLVFYLIYQVGKHWYFTPLKNPNLTISSKWFFSFILEIRVCLIGTSIENIFFSNQSKITIKMFDFTEILLNYFIWITLKIYLKTLYL